MSAFETFGIFFQAGVTLCILSFLYKESHAYRFAEHLYLGTFAAQTVLFAIKSIGDTAVLKVTEGNLIYLIPIILGCLLYTGIFIAPSNIRWISRYPIALIVATSIGLRFRAQLNTYLFRNLTRSIVDITNLGNLALVIALISGSFYFFFTFKKVISPGVDEVIRNVGMGFIMVYFGVHFGTITMGRLSQMISRMDYLLQWPAITTIPVAIAIGLVAYYVSRTKT